VEQVIRPTGLVDPAIAIHPAGSQVDDFLGEIRSTVEAGDRVLCTVLTKRMAEDLTEYYQELGVRVRYLHSDIETLERIELLKDLRTGEYDVLVGINLLREGLDLPEVSLIGVFDADKEGFLRSARSLLQVIGRAARNVNGRVILYADKVTDSMKAAIDETDRRRARQEAYNVEHGITPETIKKGIRDILASIYERDYVDLTDTGPDLPAGLARLAPRELANEIEVMRSKMFDLARDLEFEQAAEMRDQVARAEAYLLTHGGGD
jgi:excinuclease ABC subunit B